MTINKTELWMKEIQIQKEKTLKGNTNVELEKNTAANNDVNIWCGKGRP